MDKNCLEDRKMHDWQKLTDLTQNKEISIERVRIIESEITIDGDFEPPPLLERIPPKRIFCLDTNARRLAELRSARHDYLKGVMARYADQEYVRIELMHARKFYAKNPDWSVINVTNKPIEEIASEILSLRGSAESETDETLT